MAARKSKKSSFKTAMIELAAVGMLVGGIAHKEHQKKEVAAAKEKAKTEMRARHKNEWAEMNKIHNVDSMQTALNNMAKDLFWRVINEADQYVHDNNTAVTEQFVKKFTQADLAKLVDSQGRPVFKTFDELREYLGYRPSLGHAEHPECGVLDIEAVGIPSLQVFQKDDKTDVLTKFADAIYEAKYGDKKWRPQHIDSSYVFLNDLEGDEFPRVKSLMQSTCAKTPDGFPVSWNGVHGFNVEHLIIKKHIKEFENLSNQIENYYVVRHARNDLSEKHRKELSDLENER